jgi:phosphopantetheinyl transferase
MTDGTLGSIVRVAILEGDGSAVSGLACLHPRETAILSPRAVPKRQDDFRRGRWVARSLLSHALNLASNQLCILPDGDGVPWAEHDDHGRLPCSLSISHTAGMAAAAIVDLPFRVGIDVERPLESPAGVVGDYFEAGEVRLWEAGEAEDLGWRAAEIWALKEAGLKALGTGLTIPASAIVVRAIGPQANSAGWQLADLGLGLTAPGPKRPIRAWVRRWGGVVVALCVLSRGDGDGVPEPESPRSFGR